MRNFFLFKICLKIRNHRTMSKKHASVRENNKIRGNVQTFCVVFSILLRLQKKKKNSFLSHLEIIGLIVSKIRKISSLTYINYT